MADSILARPTYRSLLKPVIEAASIRNALGDIGNRIGLGPVQLGANKNEPGQILKPSVTITSTRSENVTQTHKMVISQTVTSVTESQRMLEVTSDEDESNEYEVEIIDSSRQEPEKEEEAVLDIDSGDADNPQFFSAYVRDIYSYLVQLERRYRISASFLNGKSITAKMRAVLIDWLMQVHSKFRLLQETMYLCVYLIDAYLERHDVSKIQLQLVGVTALFLACKYEEMYVPAIDDFVYMTDNTYSTAEIRAMEISMCKTLNFAFGKPLPLHFLRRFSKAGQADPKQHTLAKYFMELALHDAEFASIDPSYMAAASLCLSFKLLDGPQWNKNMEHHTGYKQANLESGMHKIANLVLRCSQPDYRYRAAFNKHTSSKCMRISLVPELSGELIRSIAASAPPPS